MRGSARLLTILAAALLVVAGCGGGATPAPTSPPAKATEASKPAAASPAAGSPVASPAAAASPAAKPDASPATASPVASPAAAAPPAAKPATGEPITVGFFSPTTGPMAADGLNARNGAELAADRVNLSGGVNGRPLRLAIYDDAGDPAQAANLARRLVQEDRALAVVSGAYSPPTTAAAPIFQQASIPLLSAYAVSPRITAAGEFVFRAGPAAAIEGAAAAIFTKENLPNSPKRVSIVAADLDPTIQLAEAFKAQAPKEGLEVVSEDKFALQENDFRPLLGRVRSANSDVVYSPAFFANAANILTQAKELGITTPFVFASSADSYKVFELARDNAAEGAYLVTDYDRSNRPVVQAFIADFKARFGNDPDIVAAGSYDAVLATAEAMRRASSLEGRAIREAIAQLKNLEDLVTGPVEEVSAERDFVRALALQVGRNGQWTSFATVPWSRITR